MNVSSGHYSVRMLSADEKSTHIGETEGGQSISDPHSSINIKYCRLLTIPRSHSYNCAYNKTNLDK